MDEATLKIVAAALLLALLLLLIVAVVVLRRDRQRLDALAEELAAVKHNLGIFNDGAQGIGRRLVEAEKQLKMVSTDQAQLKQQGSNQAYTEAALLVSQGLSAEQIVQRRDLSHAEVELMILLRDKDQVAAQAEANPTAFE